MRRLLVVSSFFFLFPFVALADVATDYSTYTAPANVNFSGGDGSNRFNVYFGETFVCQFDPIETSGNLSDGVCDGSPSWTGGNWATQSSTVGTYYLSLQTTADCNGSPPKTHSECAASNPGMPGNKEATFEITDESEPTSTLTTSSLDIAVNYADFAVDILAFAIMLFVLFLK